MATLTRLNILVIVLVSCLVGQSFATPVLKPAEVADIDPEIEALLMQDEPEYADDVLAKDLKGQENQDDIEPADLPEFPEQNEDPAETESDDEQNDEASEGEYKPEENLNMGKGKVTEGDIYLDKSTKDLLEELQHSGRDAVTNPVKHWRGGRVPYRFGPVSSRVRSAFQQAIADYNRYTCIRIVPRRSERDYIYVVSEGGCWSAIGRSGGRQKLSLGRGCEHKGTAIHEIMHAIGFFHEQSRRDRDNYITIHWGNIVRGMGYNFKKYRHGAADTLNEPYDYKSVMHYPEYAFSSNRRKTIVPKRSGVRLGQRNGFSAIDKRQVNKLYKCSGGGGGGGGSTPQPPVGGCTDKYPESNKCPNWANLGYCKRGNRYHSFMVKNCKRSCRVCGNPVRPPCKDKRRECPSWRRYCNYNRYKAFMKINCKKTCGIC